MSSGQQKFCLQWNEFRKMVTSAFYNLRQDEDFVDVTLSCDGRQIKAHRMMLSACSPYFKDVLKGIPCQHPVFILKDVSYSDLAAIIEFVYTGEVNVSQNKLSSFLKTAEMLQVRGLANEEKEKTEPASQHVIQSPACRPALSPPPPAKPSPLAAKRAFSADAPSSPSFAKRGRVDAPLPAPSHVDVPALGPSHVVPPATEPSRVFPAEWPTTAHQQPELTPPPLPPTPVSAAVSDPAPHGRVAVKTEMVAQEEGQSAESSLGVDVDFHGLTDFKMSEEALTSGVEHDPGSQGGMFFNEETSSDQIGGAETTLPACVHCGKVYRHRQSMYQHMQMHRGLTRCHVCSEVMSTPHALKKHMSIKHGDATMKR